MTDHPRPGLLQHTADVVSAHLSHNQLGVEALPQLIQSVYQALAGLGTEAEPSSTRPDPAVPIRKSVFPDYIICLEDGAKMKMLKRYLQVHFGLTPASYRERWGLPADYPMVAPNYTERRSVLAKQIGLGRRPANELLVESAPETAEQTGDGRASKARTRRKSPAAETQE